MLLQDIRDMLAAVDPDIQHYESTDTDRDYTVWAETRMLPAYANCERLDAWEVRVDRWTETEFDGVAAALAELFNSSDRVSFAYSVSYDVSTHRIHHAFVLQVV